MSKVFRDKQRSQIKQKLLNASKQNRSLTSPQKEIQLSQPNSSVAIVIAGRNSEKFLSEAIQSALEQTVPCEVLYSDDASTDSSVAIANGFISKGLRVIAHGIHTGVCATRNRGALVTKAPYIVFMDSDDRLSNSYVADMLADLQPNTPFVYPNTRPFGEFMDMAEGGVPPGTLWRNRAWSQYDMWVQNQVSTTAMWSRTAFMAAGMWDGNLPTMWDYDLAIKCSRYGLPIAGRAILDYRIHGKSVSAQLNERLPNSAIPHQVNIRRRNATLGIGCLCSGRCPDLFPLWLDRLAISVRYYNRTLLGHQQPKPKLLLLLHNDAIPLLSGWQALARTYSDTFLSVEFATLNYPVSKATPNPSPQNEKEQQVELARRTSVCNLLAIGCQYIQDYLRTDLVWLVEDDIVVPMEANKLLFEYATSGRTPPIGVSGRYYSRHPGCLNQIGGWIKEGKHEEPIPSFGPVEEVDFVGTGCLLYWPYRLSSPTVWRPTTKFNQPGATAHDWAWSEDVREKGGDLLMLGCVDCHHYYDVINYV